MLAFFSGPVCSYFGLLDIPDERKHHREPTPLIGGLTLIFCVLPLSIVAIAGSETLLGQRSIIVYVLSTFAMAIMGMTDDRRSLQARDRLLLSLLVFGSAALVDPLFCIRQLVFSSPAFQLGMGNLAFGVIFTTICCVGFVNAVNMADGKNGLVIGVSLGWLGLLATRMPGPLMPFVVLLAVSMAVLLVFNLFGKVFLGDGGTYGFACAIALMTIAVYNSQGSHSDRAMTADEIVLLFAIPVIDSFRLTFVRLSRGQSPMAPDRDHLHHHLQRRLGWPKGLIAYYLLSLVPAIFGFFQLAATGVMILVVGVLYAVAIWTSTAGTHPFESTGPAE